MKKTICLFLFALFKVSAQSVLILDAGTILAIDNGSDFCADSIGGNGVLIGNGTICGNPTNIESEDDTSLPTDFALEQNYPNPFNPTTKIRYQLPISNHVLLQVYDVLGNEVVTLVNEEKDRGVYSINFDASALASGMYLYRLSVVPTAHRDLVLKDGQAGNFIQTKKMIVIK
jgi:hypothetical protein